MTAADRLCLALDVPDLATAVRWVERTRHAIGTYKVGLELFCAEGRRVLDRLRAVGAARLFLDLKLHDIPNTMRGAIRSARALGARLLTVHAGSGVDHLRACVDEAGDALGILAVTVLTSQDARACAEAGHTRTPAELVVLRAEAARQAGCAGVVCSGQELRGVVAAAPGLFRVVPGIRPAGADAGDQKRVMTPALAIADGATHLVVGRPILQAADPAAAADAIVAEIAGAP